MPAIHEIEVWCDHQNLLYFRKPQVLTARQARWYTTLQEYHFKTIHKAGTQNGCADALSWKEELNVSEKMTDEVQVLWRLLVHEQDRPKVLALYHDHAGHFGNRKTYERMKEYYEWPGMKRDCEQFV